MEDKLYTHFQGHFGQATGTPFTIPPLRHLFRYGGHNLAVQQLPDGSLQIQHTSAEMRHLLQNFKRSRPALSPLFPREDILKGFQRWRKSTTTSPSGKHLGIYRSLVTAVIDNISCCQDKNQSTTIANILFDIQTTLLNLAIQEVHSFNIQADKEATHVRKNIADIDHTSTGLQGEIWSLEIGDSKVVKNIDASLREYIMLPTIRDKWDTMDRVNGEGFNMVAWDTVKQVMRSSTNSTKHWVIKRAARDCGANAILFQRRKKGDDKCPFCSNKETVMHVYTCQHQQVQDIWGKAIYDLEIELIKQQTAPEIIKELSNGLMQWQKGKTQITGSLIQDQNKIGWNGILEGCLGKHWIVQQGKYYSKHKIKKREEKWATLVVRRLWKIAWALWEHRNDKEHTNDKEKEYTELQMAVEEEIAKGWSDLQDADFMFTEDELNKARGKNLAYKRAWLRNVQGRRTAAQLDPQQREMQAMRRNMYRFLDLVKK
jgi:hypothetical protein